MALSISNAFIGFGHENQCRRYVGEGADAFCSGNANNLSHMDFASPFSCLFFCGFFPYPVLQVLLKPKSRARQDNSNNNNTVCTPLN